MFLSSVNGRSNSTDEENDTDNNVKPIEEQTGATLVKIGFFEVNPVTKTGSCVFLHQKIIRYHTECSKKKHLI